MNAQLIPDDGGPPLVLAKDLTLFGRDKDCDVRLDHKSISKLHCVVVKTDGLLLVRDLGSTNGTRVNGQRIRRAALLPNDHFAIANLKYRVAFGGDVEPPAVARVEEAKPEEPQPPLQKHAHPDLYPDPKTPRT